MSSLDASLLETCDDVLVHMTCENATSQCYMGKCDDCPRETELKEILERSLRNNRVEKLTYRHWVATPYTTLTTKTDVKLGQFIKDFCALANLLLPHAFYTKQQSSYLKWLKANLKPNQCIILRDFSENYAYVIQRAAPGYHFNNQQATIYTVLIYYLDKDGTLQHKSLVIISDCTHHDATAVYAFTKHIIKLVKSLIPDCEKIFYFSDGAPSQYKNYKNFVNLYFHFDDFKIHVEWHFFTTAHGKGPCDGTGGTVKRLAARASLQRSSEDQITNAEELYNWAKSHFESIAIEYTPQKEYDEAKEFLQGRFEQANSIEGTQKLHAVIPSEDGMVLTKPFSFSKTSVKRPILKSAVVSKRKRKQ